MGWCFNRAISILAEVRGMASIDKWSEQSFKNKRLELAIPSESVFKALHLSVCMCRFIRATVASVGSPGEMPGLILMCTQGSPKAERFRRRAAEDAAVTRSIEAYSR